jgi:hypothetical protein
MTGSLRPREHWLGGLPTFDIEMAWREPLWQGEDPRWNREPRDDLLSPAEFMQFFEALPDWEFLERAPAQAAARARQWERRHPSGPSAAGPHHPGQPLPRDCGEDRISSSMVDVGRYYNANSHNYL